MKAGYLVALFTPAGPVAAAERNVMVTMAAVMLAVVIPLFITFLVVAWKYRAGKSGFARYPEPPHNAGYEMLLWVIPVAVVIVLAPLTWNSAHALDPYNPIKSQKAPMTIQVVALPWKWLFIYPAQNIATVNVVEFPEQTPIHFELTADAPMSSFWIPQLGSQIYAMAAMQTQLNLMADTTGQFAGKDTEINGAGYSGMKFTATSASPADFNNWVSEVRQKSNMLDSSAYAALAKPSQNNPPAYYSFVQQGLFDSVIMKFMAPATAPKNNPQQNVPAPQMPGMDMQ